MSTRTIVAIMDPQAAFPTSAEKPETADLAGAIGRRAFAQLGKIQSWMTASYPTATWEWKFSPRSGWYLVPWYKKRRLFYLVPKKGGFRLSIILGEKVVTPLKTGTHAKAVSALLKEAKQYPEGTFFSFDEKNLDPELVIALTEVKITP